MNLHLVGGFLGSGKTTAIIMAARSLMAKGKAVGVITNDQGKYLVDTAFFAVDDIPTVEVTGGCFCCNYDDLDARVDQLIEHVHPDVIFAESVGSCADLVATVLKPLLELRPGGSLPRSFSVFADIRLLQMRLEGEELPFSQNVIYIFDKQIEEAGLLVINKKDLIGEPDASAVVAMAGDRFPGKNIVPQNSLSQVDIENWLAMIETAGLPDPGSRLDIDYDRYGDGEARLAWLDATIHLSAPMAKGKETIEEVIEAFLAVIRQNGASIGHLKFLVKGASGEIKVSIPTIDDGRWKDTIPSLDGGSFVVLANARVEMEASLLISQIRGALERLVKNTGLRIELTDVDCFHPGFPTPTHRMA
jgi:G3E family GTPase